MTPTKMDDLARSVEECDELRERCWVARQTAKQWMLGMLFSLLFSVVVYLFFFTAQNSSRNTRQDERIDQHRQVLLEIKTQLSGMDRIERKLDKVIEFKNSTPLVR